MTGPASASRELEWHALVSRPAETIDPARLDACFDNRLGATLCGRLKGSRRLQDRLSRVVREHYALRPQLAADAISDIDRAVALAGVERVTELVRRGGAIYWGRTIAGVVRAQDVRALHAQLGEEVCRFAVAHQDLSGPKQPLEQLDGAATRIEQDGWRCLGAWCHDQPADIGMRVRLRLPARPELDDQPEPLFADIGPAIIRYAASERPRP